MMTRTEYPKLGETVIRFQLACGLTVKIVPRPGFQKKLAYFATDFGSIHTEFSLDGQNYQVPAGIAHFLEHKMFELPERDVTAEFAAQGASVNAFTSYDMTAYYFSCTENFEKNLRLLLEFVSTPYFPAESVSREIGIIDQEIGMAEDSPDRIFENLMQILFREHPIRVPILGSRESIREITPELLKLCHRAFYTPANMVLCVVGDVDPQQVAALAEEVLGTEYRPAGMKTGVWHEDLTSFKKLDTANMEVAMPMFQMGFQCAPVGSGVADIRQEIIGDLAAEALFGESSELYLRLYEEGLIDASFGGGFESVDGGAMLMCGGDSRDCEAVGEAILEQAKVLIAQGIPQGDFLRMKRSAMGRRVRNLDSFDSTCFRQCAYHFTEFEYFEFPDVYAGVTVEEILAFLAEVIVPERSAMAIIRPVE